MQSSPLPFNIPPPRTRTAETPEELFSFLQRRDPAVEQLWSHQADMLREFHGLHNESDIALELPTGSGKTLIALLIAEWTRLTKQARVLYLCANNALVDQVAEKATGYGINALPFTGPHAQYDPSSVTAFNRAGGIGITSYWTLFNTNPRLSPTHIILDDAHAALQAVMSLWTTEIGRRNNHELFDRLITLFDNWLGDALKTALQKESPERITELVPPPVVIQHGSDIANLLDQHLEPTSDSAYGWRMIRDNLPACNMFVTPSTISFRPTIPPTFSAQAFSKAAQRVFVSATLSRNGDLERTFARPKIKYINSNLKGSIGRRLILFGDDSGLHDFTDPLFSSLVATTNRTVILTTSDRAADALADVIRTHAPQKRILRNADVRQSYSPFADSDNAVLILANRYDGLDLPGDTCRLLIMIGLPTTGDVEEQFLWTSLGDRKALSTRLSTRISQGLGRTARGFRDFTVSLLYGQDLLDYASVSENVRNINPVLGAELQFGLDQLSLSYQDQLATVRSFLDQDPLWEAAELHLREEIQALGSTSPSHPLFDLSKHEIGYAKAMWDGDYDAAANLAKRIVDTISPDHFAGYKAWWHLQLATSAYLARGFDDQFTKIALQSLHEGKQHSLHGRIFSDMRRAILSHIQQPEDPLDTAEEEDEVVARSIVELLEKLGFNGRKFQEQGDSILSRIDSREPSQVHAALYELGRWLGFECWYENVRGAPDGIWRLPNRDLIIFEAKTDKTSTKLSLSDLRQAAGHDGWARDNLPIAKDGSRSKTIVVSDCTEYDKTARSFADQLYHVRVEEVEELVDRAVNQLSTIRNKAAGNWEPLKTREVALEILLESEISPSALFERLGDSKLSEALTSS